MSIHPTTPDINLVQNTQARLLMKPTNHSQRHHFHHSCCTEMYLVDFRVLCGEMLFERIDEIALSQLRWPRVRALFHGLPGVTGYEDIPKRGLLWRHTVFDFIINTSCEHMFPMTKFKQLNRGFFNDVVYVLQSTNEDKYEDHINCVSGPEELAEQAKFVDVMYSGTKTLDNGMERFMVIGK